MLVDLSLDEIRTLKVHVATVPRPFNTLPHIIALRNKLHCLVVAADCAEGNKYIADKKS